MSAFSELIQRGRAARSAEKSIADFSDSIGELLSRSARCKLGRLIMLSITTESLCRLMLY